MAKVLLINSNRFKHPWPVMPYGLCYVAAALESGGKHIVSFLDLCFSKNCEEDIRKSIRSFNPDIIGISIRNIDDTGGYHVHFLLEDVKNDVTDNCKKEFQGPIIIGGPSVGISGREMLEYFDLEYAVAGDGELVMSEFARRVESGEITEGLNGLIIRKNNTIVQESEPCRVPDLDLLITPDPRRYLNLDQYRKFGSPLLIQTKRGCAFKCAYCTYNHIEGRQYRLRNPVSIADEIEKLVTTTGINNIEFADSLFNAPLSHAKDVLRSIIDKKLKLRLHAMGLTPAAIDEELTELMKNAGFNQVDIGAESFCEPILKSLSKDFTLKDISRTVELLKKNRIPSTWFIILGAPAETRETVIESLTSAMAIIPKWDLVFVSTGVRVYKGSPYANEFIRGKSDCSPDSFFLPVKIEPEKISLNEIHDIARQFSFSYPNLYFYEKENITPAWQLISATFMLKLFNSEIPVWRLLIALKKFELLTGISRVKRYFDKLRRMSSANKHLKPQGFSLISPRPKPS